MGALRWVVRWVQGQCGGRAAHQRRWWCCRWRPGRAWCRHCLSWSRPGCWSRQWCCAGRWWMTGAAQSSWSHPARHHAASFTTCCATCCAHLAGAVGTTMQHTQFTQHIPAGISMSCIGSCVNKGACLDNNLLSAQVVQCTAARHVLGKTITTHKRGACAAMTEAF